MGRKRARAGKLILFYIAWGVTVSLAGCASLSSLHQKTEAEEHLNKAERFLHEDNFERALKENERAKAHCSGKELCARVLYNKGQILLDAENPDRSYRYANKSFSRLVREYSHSSLVGKCQNWVQILTELAEKKQNLRCLEMELHEVRQDKSSLQTAVKKYEQKIKDFRTRLASLKKRLAKYREQLKKLKKIDLELNRKKGNNRDGEGANSGS